MNTLNVIIDHPLPLNQDYRALKEKGLAFIQEHSGQEWTNLNNVDPGVTILDQLCYALTELGYCNDFSVADILTKADGNLPVKDQFYLPEEILTTSPVTLDDYRKCVIDGVVGVTNAVIVPVQATVYGGNGAYQVYLQADIALETVEARENLCRAAYIYLNKWRNLGELFLTPVCLIVVSHTIQGRMEISDETKLNEVLIYLQDKVQNYIFPVIKPIGYDALNALGIHAEDIFNGPLLQNGWIPTSALGAKKDQLTLMELQQLILHVDGMSAVSGLIFDQQPLAEEIHTSADHLLVIDWAGSLNRGLEIYCKGKKLVTRSSVRSLAGSSAQPSDPGLVFGTAANIRSTVPKGKFRDINSYYSIQNTFPEIFAVGTDATVSNATDFQIAQSRQLKGYLTLFDQVLANQFAQLANVGTLFSFKNALSGTPSDQAHFYAVKDRYEKLKPEYPVPYLTFSPTYFYQSLYAVPHIRPLLKDNEIFSLSLEAESEKELQHKSWIAYQRDPYNPYIKGLMDIMEDQTNLSRRNKILNHLLARHGESPLLIDSILNGAVYAGESLKDLVIFKSLYLQNLGLLSYFRQKAYNFLAANKISGSLTDVSLDFEQQILSGYSNDFIFSSGKIDHIEELTAADFINYSALELKLCLLFGLRVQYRDFIANNYREKTLATALKLAMWMITERRGMILIETGLLLAHQVMPATAPQLVLIFPDFILQETTAAVFKDRLEIFLEESVPLHVTYSYHFVNSSMLERVILAFSDWHNSLIYPSDPDEDKYLVSNASSLLQLINQINMEKS